MNNCNWRGYEYANFFQGLIVELLLEVKTWRRRCCVEGDYSLRKYAMSFFTSVVITNYSNFYIAREVSRQNNLSNNGTLVMSYSDNVAVGSSRGHPGDLCGGVNQLLDTLYAATIKF